MSGKDAVAPEHDVQPELTERDFVRAITFNDVLVREASRHEGGQGGPARATVGFALDADPVERIRASGPNYDARVEAVLNEALAAGRI